MQKLSIYQVLPRFWGNGRFSDWKSDSFDYVKSLGMNCIWFTGIPRHASGEDFVKGNLGSPYAISDYYDVNPYLADDEDRRMLEFERLLKRAHASGLKVIIDFVPNHVARNYSDIHGGIPLYDHCDYDWSDTLKVNYSDHRTWEAMYEILNFWASKGVDGFRCDMVELVPVEFFGWLTSSLRKQFPALLFIAEAYSKDNYEVCLQKGGFDLLYDKSGVYDILRSVMCDGSSAEALTWNWQSLGPLQSRMLNFLENHDEQRIASSHFAGSPDKAYAALAAAALFNSASFMLYAGQEVGESASGSDNGRTSIFDSTKVEILERRRGNEVLKRYREILSHLSEPAFSEGGNWDLGYCNGDSAGFDRSRHFAFLRYDNCSCYLVVCNFSDKALSADIRIPDEAQKICCPGRDSIRVESRAWDAAILRID